MLGRLGQVSLVPHLLGGEAVFEYIACTASTASEVCACIHSMRTADPRNSVAFWGVRG